MADNNSFLDDIQDAPAQAAGSPYATIDPAVLASRQPAAAPQANPQAPTAGPEANPSQYDEFQLADNIAKNPFIRDVAHSDFVWPALMRASTDLGFTPDPNYHAPAYGSPEYKALTDGIAPEYQDRLASAVSADHAQWLHAEIINEQNAQQRLAAYGGWGVAGRMALNLTDPVQLAIGAASGGVGVATKANRITKVLAAAGSGAAANAAISAAVDAGTPTRDFSDLGWSALLGAGLGTVGGVWATQAEKNLARRLTAQVSDHLEAQEAVRFLNDRGIEVPPALAEKAKAPQVTDLTGAGPDAGAAAVRDAVQPNEPIGKEVSDLDPVARTYAPGFRLDIAARLRGSEDPEVRALLGKLVGDPVGTGSEAVSAVGASDVAQRLENSYLAKFYTALNEHLPEWAQANGTKATSYADRVNFMSQVADYIRGGTTEDAHVRGFGDKVRALLNEVREDAKGAGVKGFETIPQDPHYLPRQIDHAEVERWNKDYGTDSVNQALESAIHAANPDIEHEALYKLAAGYHQRLREVGRGMDAAASHGIRLDDRDFVHQLITEGGGDRDLADRVQRSIEETLQRRETGEGSVRYSKNRLDLDEGHVVRLKNNTTGNIDELPISSLFNSNVEELVNRYAGSMAGHIGLAKEAGITSMADFEGRLNQVRARVADGRQRESIVNAAKVAYSLITKTPVIDRDADHAAGSIARWGRQLRALNYARQMGSMVWAHLGELGKIAAVGNLRAVMQHVPLLRSALGGGMDKELAREIVETMGLGAEHLIDRRFVGDDPLASGIYNSTNRVMQKLTHAVSVGQGFSHTISAMQVLAGKVSAQRLLNTALEGGSTYSAKRLAWMGMDAGMTQRVANELKAHATVSEGVGGTQLRAMNLANWTDLDARDAAIAAVRRDATRMVQSNEVGSALASKAAHSTLAKIVLQFRQYALHAYAKSTMQGLAQGDTEAYLRFATSSAWAALIYTAEQTLKREAYKGASAVMGNHNTDETLKHYDENLTLPEIAKAGFARAGLFSLLPSVADTAAQLVTGKPFFNKRVSGLQSGAFSMDTNPTMQALNGIATHIGHFHKGEPTSGDLRFWLSMLPFRNVTGVGQVLDAVADKANLPKKAQ